jgi:hypothetical protein
VSIASRAPLTRCVMMVRLGLARAKHDV